MSREDKQEKYVTCVRNIEFHAAHATPVNGTPLLHGHTFIVHACVEGELTEGGWVVDFTLLSNAVKEVINQEYNFRLLLNREDASKVKIIAPFNVRITYVNGPPTAELLAKDICQKLSRRLLEEDIPHNNIKVCRVTVCEGNDLCAEYLTHFTRE